MLQLPVVSRWHPCACTFIHPVPHRRGETCGQLKVSVTAAGRSAGPTDKPFLSSLTPDLESSSSHTPNNPAANRRLRADVISVAAPGKSANQAAPMLSTDPFQSGPLIAVAPYQEDKSLGHERGGNQSSQGRVSSQQAQTAESFSSADAGQEAEPQTHTYTEAPGMHAPLSAWDAEDPRLQLRTQMQQLNELSHLMSHRLALDDHQASGSKAEAVKHRVDATSHPEGVAADASSQAAYEARAIDHSSSVRSKQHAQHDAGAQRDTEPQHDTLPQHNAGAQRAQQEAGPQHAQRDDGLQHVRQSAQMHSNLGEPLLALTGDAQREAEHSQGKAQGNLKAALLVHLCLSLWLFAFALQLATSSFSHWLSQRVFLMIGHIDCSICFDVVLLCFCTRCRIYTEHRLKTTHQ